MQRLDALSEAGDHMILIVSYRFFLCVYGRDFIWIWQLGASKMKAFNEKLDSIWEQKMFLPATVAYIKCIVYVQIYWLCIL